MRRRDREITDKQEILEVMRKCDVCRIALHDGDYPYIVPLNFGLQVENDMPVLYFHGALEGKKYELIEKDNRASFEMDCGHQLILDKAQGNCAMEYESVIGQGYIEMLNEEEKYEALRILMKQYRREDFPFNEKVIPMTAVFRLRVESMPCGACRQVLSELLLPDTPILIANDKEEKILTMRELLPYSFGEDDLKK